MFIILLFLALAAQQISWAALCGRKEPSFYLSHKTTKNFSKILCILTMDKSPKIWYNTDTVKERSTRKCLISLLSPRSI